MTHVNLMILTPGHSVLKQYIDSLMATASLLATKNITFGWSGAHSSNVYDARELTLNGSSQLSMEETKPFSGQVTYDKLLWIDSDIIWQPEDVLKLYESDKDVISGVYFQTNGNIMAFTELFGQPLTYKDIEDKRIPFEIYAAGFGFVCFKSGVFESLSRPWFQMKNGTKMLEGKEITFPIMGEDLSLFQRVQEANISVWLDPTVIVGHVKPVICTQYGMGQL